MGLRQFINRDLDFQNETKRGVVSVRILYIVTMTFGLTEYDFGGDMEKAIKEADEKLYLGKTGGRNKVVY